ncbi:MAG TPA: ATP-dependent DNA ligase, partial [Chthoniobacteraceae bacterium]|nr:ATP-dependent DNA ligase [Chthoniobacteraceae bacterium]
MIITHYHRGVELPDYGLWLDPWDPKPLAFVSHAHSDHVAAHHEIIASAGTARLMQARLPGKRLEHVLEYGVREQLAGVDVTLIPAGHIFGSAQILIESAQGSLLYTGDFKLRHGLSAEPAEWRPAETLVMETTYGLPKYRMPPTEETLARMVEFCRDTLDDGGVPILLGYSLGKAQEILCALLKANLTPMLHGSVFHMTEIYRALKPAFPDGYLRYVAEEVSGKVLVCPPSANRSIMTTRIKNRRTAILTGWALDPGATYRYQVDAAFPLTDHADYPDLVRYVELVNPQRVLTLHGFAAAFARDLRARGIEAWALSETNQLELTLAGWTPLASPLPAAASHDPTTPAANSEFYQFAALGEQISAMPSKLKKIELLRNYLRSLPPAELAIAAVYLTGRAFPQSDPRTLQTGWAILKRALLSVSKISEQEFRAIANLHSDAGKTAHDALFGRTTPMPFTLPASKEFFEQLQHAREPMRKTEMLTAQLRALTPLEASYLVRIITGDLRIGLKEGLVEEAIASAFAADADEVREANMLLGDIGRTALLAGNNALDNASLQIFRPIKCMLASPEPDADAAAARIAGIDAWAEDKFDGIRAHLHAAGARVEIFTRDLRPVTDQFADLARAARAISHSVILDGEIVAFEAGRKLTFFDLQKRLGRKTEDDLFFGRSDIPVVYKVFDLLHCDGVSLLKTPLRERRARLAALALPAGLELAHTEKVSSAPEIERAFQAARRRGNEGLMIKDTASFYTPGRRGIAWLKIKKELATLDVVVVGAESGHGRRSHVLSDYTFAVRDDRTGALLTIGKAYSGLTDQEIEQLTEHFRAHTLVKHGRFREVRPDTVLEVAFDSVQPSSRHSSGLALRFPRIKAIRRDKSPAEIDTVSFAR